MDLSYPLTLALEASLRAVVQRSPGIESITPYVFMPDHVHFLLKIAAIPERRTLPYYVNLITRALAQTIRDIAHIDPNTLIFQSGFHDYVVKSPKQLQHFIQYIHNNPKMALLRQSNKELFYCWRGFFHDRLGSIPCDLTGNINLLDVPILVPVQHSRSVVPGTPSWQELQTVYRTWNPSVTAVGTWRSSAEREVQRIILARGGTMIILSPEGFLNRWHPAGTETQQLCTEGRLLFLSPYQASPCKLNPREARIRCLALNALAKSMATTSLL